MATIQTASSLALPAVSADTDQASTDDRSWFVRHRGNLAFVALLIAIVVSCRLVGLAANPVLSSSMEPTYETGDVVFSLPPELIDPQVGSVIIFDQRIGSRTEPVMHRVVGTDANGRFLTKGDNNPVADPWAVDRQSITGVLFGGVPTGSLNG